MFQDAVLIKYGILKSVIVLMDIIGITMFVDHAPKILIQIQISQHVFAIQVLMKSMDNVLRNNVL